MKISIDKKSILYSTIVFITLLFSINNLKSSKVSDVAYKDNIIEKEKIIYKDKIIYKEIDTLASNKYKGLSVLEYDTKKKDYMIEDIDLTNKYSLSTFPKIEKEDLKGRKLRHVIKISYNNVLYNMYINTEGDTAYGIILSGDYYMMFKDPSFKNSKMYSDSFYNKDAIISREDYQIKFLLIKFSEEHKKHYLENN